MQLKFYFRTNMPLEDQCSALSYVSNLQSLMLRASSKYTLLRIAGSIANDGKLVC